MKLPCIKSPTDNGQCDGKMVLLLCRPTNILVGLFVITVISFISTMHQIHKMSRAIDPVLRQVLTHYVAQHPLDFPNSPVLDTVHLFSQTRVVASTTIVSSTIMSSTKAAERNLTTHQNHRAIHSTNIPTPNATKQAGLLVNTSKASTLTQRLIRQPSTTKTAMPDVTKTAIPDATKTQRNANLLTLVTTFIDVKHRINIQSNVIRNWATFMPDIQPILYMPFLNGTMVELAKSYGWLVFPVPRVNNNGTPYLKDLFFDAAKRTKSVFYGFCNGDILFTEGLLQTLRGIRRDLDGLNTTLVIGRRTNLAINPNDTKPFYKHVDIMKRAKSGELYRMDAEDYFIMSNVSRFPWINIKDVVIGRPGYDNYIVAITLRSNQTVVDATETILALHQTGVDGNSAGAKHADAQFNKKLIGKFNYNVGLTGNAKYTSHFDFRNNVFLLKRNETVAEKFRKRRIIIRKVVRKRTSKKILPKTDIPRALTKIGSTRTLPKTDIPRILPKDDILLKQLPKIDVPRTLPQTAVPRTLPKTDVPRTLPKTDIPRTLPKTDIPRKEK